MRTKSKWKVKKLILKNEVICEYEFQALQIIGKDILDGKFKIELEKEEQPSAIGNPTELKST